MNRRERRRANKTRPLARLGVPIHTRIARVRLGPQTTYFWWASENPHPNPEELELHGPFESEAEADEAARIAVVGPDCEITEGGTWEPAWDRPQ
jgi:hypothetical protein